jgi:hypothetical protein
MQLHSTRLCLGVAVQYTLQPHSTPQATSSAATTSASTADTNPFAAAATAVSRLQEYVTLPPAFYVEMDLEQQVLVERASSNPYTLLTSGLHQLELQQLIQVHHTACHVTYV